MNIDALKIFVTVAKYKNFSRAAEHLNFSQPTISLHIRNLEEEFNEQLLYRSPKYVELTKAGKVLYRNANKILTLYSNTKDEINHLSNIVSGSIKIGASYTIGEYLLPKYLAQFTSAHPDVDIEVMIKNTEEITELIRQARLDIGLIEGKIVNNDLVVKPFLEDEMVLVTSPSSPIASKDDILPTQLNNQTWIFREIGSGTRAYSDYLIKEWNLSIMRSYIFNSSQGIKEAVLNNLGIAVLSHIIVEKELERGELVAISINKAHFTRTLSFIHQTSHSFSMAERVFVNEILEK
ncbi:LysR family transcriptional regulator [Cytobacillus sp. IB215665]|uniref:LysR family transcriptional regulator n=1 Tax=Cytobacillus sp. IB215665 TaxID=3097357 RepID=UPI002A175FB7|nr:LysR family transcriptional regulator [Cytobacillus sp. IB215665]MDX8364547.1 LysR family transcriptional regulator [Cytobacillus sp. IB215665]